MATAKDPYSDFTFKQIPIYFQEKSPNLVELSFFLPELWTRNLKGGAEHPLGRIGLKKTPKETTVHQNNETPVHRSKETPDPEFEIE